MGIVYLAEHPFSEQKVALKVIIPNHASKNAIDSFVREVRLLARFNHRGIARLLDADTFEADGTHYPYFVMELIEGAKKVTDFVRDARCDEQRRLELILQTAAAVAQTHRMKVVHGDIKPSNVLVGLDGEVKVVDFGAAIDGAAGDDTLRALTLAYAAPEQVEQMRAVLASDVYSLAILAYEILTGCRPDGSPIRVERTIMGAPDCRTSPPITAANGGASEGTEKEGGLGNNSLPAAMKAIPIRALNPKINKKTEKVLLHALAEKPEHRYPDAEVFRSDLEAARRGGLLSIEERTTWNRARAFRAEHQGLVAAVLIIFIVLLMGIAGTA